ncbi:MAG: DMT family transporter [Candidatus Rokubacteria bacterium]|nr:DMT family transporter [Candidatus Rokubacteria bacterium]
MPPARQTRSLLTLVLVVLLWGSYPPLAKVALVDFPPLILVTLRTSLASVFLAVLLLRRGWDEFRALGAAAELRVFAVLGFAGIFLSTGGTYLGIAFTTAASAAILQAVTPILVAIGARLYLGERLRADQWLGVWCSLLGVLLVITRASWRAVAGLELQPGDFLLLLSQAGWAVYTIYGKRVLAVHSPAVATTTAYIAGSLMLLPVAVLTAPLFPAPNFAAPVAWLVVATQAFLGGIAHVYWYEAVRSVGPSQTAIFMNLQPVVGVLLAYWLLGERIEPGQILGGIAVLLGVALTTRPGPAAR